MWVAQIINTLNIVSAPTLRQAYMQITRWDYHGEPISMKYIPNCRKKH